MVFLCKNYLNLWVVSGFAPQLRQLVFLWQKRLTFISKSLSLCVHYAYYLKQTSDSTAVVAAILLSTLPS